MNSRSKRDLRLITERISGTVDAICFYSTSTNDMVKLKMYLNDNIISIDIPPNVWKRERCSNMLLSHRRVKLAFIPKEPKVQKNIRKEVLSNDNSSTRLHGVS